MPDRLMISEDSLFPIQTFFNAISDESFLRVIASLANGVGCVINDCGCLFPGDLDPCDDMFDGVQFFLFENSIVISNQELAGYIRRVCKEYVDRHPEEKDNVARILTQL